MPCCENIPIRRTLNYSLGVVAGTGCCLDGLAGQVFYQDAGPYAGYWVSPVVTLAGCVDFYTGAPLPPVDVLVILYWVSGMTGGAVCCGAVVPYPAGQNGCTYDTPNNPFFICYYETDGFGNRLHFSCSPFDIRVRSQFSLAAGCPGGGTLSYCGTGADLPTVEFRFWE